MVGSLIGLLNSAGHSRVVIFWNFVIRAFTAHHSNNPAAKVSPPAFHA